MPNFNCACDDGSYTNETLGELRTSLFVRLGFAAQVDNPPPGMAALLNDFLQRGQKFLIKRYREQLTIRMFSWVMTAGERFYGLRDNDPDGDGSEDPCYKKINPRRIQWAGIEDLNGMWSPMRYGIPPEFYTAVNFNGIPAFFEIKQCIEVFPAPTAAYTLRIKGLYEVSRFTEDDDKTTVDSELVFLWALANAKNHYGQPDARDVASQAQTYLRDLISESHQTARYVPGTVVLPQMPQPVFLPLVP